MVVIFGGTISACTFSINNLEVGNKDGFIFLLIMSYAQNRRSSYLWFDISKVFINAKHAKSKSYSHFTSPFPISKSTTFVHILRDSSRISQSKETV